jgi:DNA ligase (NAD+)
MDLIKKIIKDPISSIQLLDINEIETIIRYSADKYYNTDKPVISDVLYDLLIDFLRARNPKSKVLNEVGAKIKSKNKVKLDYWLGSMDKIKPEHLSQFDTWTKKYKKPYYISDKLDGVSALLTYTIDGDIKLFTRGTANEGQDITNLIKYLNVPLWTTINKYIIKTKLKTDNEKNIIAFRGELIIPAMVFKTNWITKLKNARNAVSGLVNSKIINPDLAKDTQLVLYEVVDPCLKIEDQFNIIQTLGFNIVNYKKVNEINFDFLSSYLVERRKNSDYLIDGIIVTNNELHEKNIDGNPLYAFAFKDILEDQKAESKIIEIEWKVSKNGYLNPTVVIEPVSIGGVEIKRVTANNAKYVVENGLGKNGIIEIIRSGDVIPKIIKVIKKVKPDLPKEKWHWNETNVDIITDDMVSDDVNIRNIYFFFSTLETRGLGEKNIEKMYYSGLNTVLKIINATTTDLLNVEGFKEKTASNIIQAIKTSLTNVSLPKLMLASNKLGEGIGFRRMTQVLEEYPKLLLEYNKWTKKEFIEKIKKLDGWEEKTTLALVNNFNNFIKFYDKIKSFLTLEKKKTITETKLTGNTMVLSGFRDQTLQNKLEQMGVKISNSISKNTTYLIVKDQSIIDEGTGKVEKAKELNIKIITKDKLLSML